MASSSMSLETPNKKFPYNFFGFEDGTGHPFWVPITEISVLSEEWSNVLVSTQINGV
jgi:hypothetical protein